MTNEELRELYSHCIYCMLDDDTEKELSDWELREIFIPTINDMIDDGYDTEQIKDFVECCYYCYFMSAITLHALIEKYDLEIEIDEYDGLYSDIYDYWRDNGYFVKVARLNK